MNDGAHTGPLTTLSPLDTLRVAGRVILPPLMQGVIIRRPALVALAERLDADRRSGRLLRRLRDRYGPGPLRLRIPGREVALTVSAPDVERLLAGTPHPFTPATHEKRAALRHFQPAGLLISDEEHRAVRRPFNERVLDLDDPTHRLRTHVDRIVESDVDALLEALPAHAGETLLTWDDFKDAFWRIVRRLTLGEAARDDADVSALMERLRRRANWAYLVPVDRRGLRELADRLRAYARQADQNSLIGMTRATPAGPGVAPLGQIPHWLFAFDAAGIATYRALALLAAHPSVASELRAEPLAVAHAAALASTAADSPAHAAVAGPSALARAALLESVRLWPTTLLLLRESVEPTIWSSGHARAGTTFVMVSSFFHREVARPDVADAFSPEIWSAGDPPGEAFVPFSSGPAACAGRTLVLDLAGSVLTRLVADHDLTLAVGRGRLAADRPLPRTLDQTSLQILLTPRRDVKARRSG